MSTHIRSSFLTHQMVISIFLPIWDTEAAHEKDKNKQLHAGGTWICDIIVMLKSHHHFAFQLIQDFLEVFPCFPI